MLLEAEAIQSEANQCVCNWYFCHSVMVLAQIVWLFSQIALLNTLAEGSALHLLPSRAKLPPKLQSSFEVSEASEPLHRVAQAYVQLAVDGQLLKAYDTGSLVWEMAVSVLQAHFTTGIQNPVLDHVPPSPTCIFPLSSQESAFLC